MCKNCHNRAWWEYRRVGGTRVTVNFIPLGTHGAKAGILCTVCDRGFALDRKNEKQARALVKLNQALNSGKIGADEFLEGCLANQLWLDFADRQASVPLFHRWNGTRWVSIDGRFYWDGNQWRGVD
jgi:hypothetical protein